jgi:hypothetical protein
VGQGEQCVNNNRAERLKNSWGITKQLIFSFMAPGTEAGVGSAFVTDCPMHNPEKKDKTTSAIAEGTVLGFPLRYSWQEGTAIALDFSVTAP